MRILKFFIIRLKSKEFTKIIPLIYVIGMVIGLLFTIAYAFFHNLVVCSTFFGQEFCTPTGIFIALMLSLPGYVIAGNLLSLIPNFPWIISLVVVIVVSASFYYLLGWLIDQKRSKKMTTGNFTKYLTVFIFVVLVLILVALIR